MARRKQQHEEHENAERYLITYADLITLLLGLFVILYATSQVDAGKFSELKAALSTYFEESKGKMQETSNGVMPGTVGVPQPILPTSGSGEKTIDQVTLELESATDKMIRSGLVQMERTEAGVVLRLSEKLLFTSGQADVQGSSLPVLDSISNVLRGISQTIVIRGFSDSIPIRTFQFESNWHLSVARALNVAWYCMTKGGLSSSNIVVEGYGPERPVAPNTTEQGRAANRRVEFYILDKDPEKPSTEGYLPTQNE